MARHLRRAKSREKCRKSFAAFENLQQFDPAGCGYSHTALREGDGPIGNDLGIGDLRGISRARQRWQHGIKSARDLRVGTSVVQRVLAAAPA